MTQRSKVILLCLSHMGSVVAALFAGSAVALFLMDASYRNIVRQLQIPEEEPLPVVSGFWLDSAKSKLEHIRNMGGGGTLLLWFGDYGEAQRIHGGYEQYRDVLLDWIVILELLKNRGHVMFSWEPQFHGDRMQAYVGLSNLENANDHPEESQRYMALATEECALSQFHDECTPENLKFVVDTLLDYWIYAGILKGMATVK